MTAERMEFLDGRPVIDPAICNGKPTIRGKRITDGAIRSSTASTPEYPENQHGGFFLNKATKPSSTKVIKRN